MALHSWPAYRFLIISDSGSSKTNLLLNLVKHQQPDIDKIYLYIKYSNQGINCLSVEEKK